jgi:toxin ParE1/3/4
MADQRWRVRLGAAAEVDFANILKWTTEDFGARQSRVYRDALVQAIGELADGPDAAGSKARDDIMAGLRALHVARRGSSRKSFPYVPGRAEQHDRNRAHLHDRMDLRRHVPSAPDVSTE